MRAGVSAAVALLALFVLPVAALSDDKKFPFDRDKGDMEAEGPGKKKKSIPIRTSFIGKGRDGARRSPKRDRTIQTNGDNLPPGKQACGQQFTVSGRANKEFVSCQGINYKNLYDRAGAMADISVGSVTCPAKCRPPRVVETARIWNCVKPSTRTPAVATATVEKMAACPGPNVRLPTGLKPPPDKAYSAPRGGLGDLSKQPDIIDDFVSAATLGCPQREIIRLEFQETAPKTCRRTRFDYGPYVTRATTLAEAQFGSYKCAPGCRKNQPFKSMRRLWRCQPADFSKTVQVRVDFEVVCLPKN